MRIVFFILFLWTQMALTSTAGSAPPAQRASGAPRVPVLRAGAPQGPLRAGVRRTPRSPRSPGAAGSAPQAPRSGSAVRPARLAGHVGIAVGTPTGLTGDVYFDRANRGFADFGLISDSVVANAGWEHHFAGRLWHARNGRLKTQSLLGLGFHAHLSKKSLAGIGPVLGEEFAFKGSPFFIFVRLFPMIRIYPSTGYNFNALVGLTFGF